MKAVTILMQTQSRGGSFDFYFIVNFYVLD